MGERAKADGSNRRLRRTQHSQSNLIELVARVLLEPADVSHCEPVPLVRPAEQLPVEVREQSALLLHSQMHTKCRVYII